MTNDQRRAVAYGLQAHSIGGTYPFCVVGIGNGARHHWEIHNLQRDTVLCLTTGNCGRVKLPADQYDWAAHLAERASAGELPEPAWYWEARLPGVKIEVPLMKNYFVQAQALAAAYKPVHGGYPDTNEITFHETPADETWPYPGVSRYT